MNVDHFGILFSISLILVILTYVLLTTVGISIFPEPITIPESSTAYADYCKQLNLRC